MNYKMVESRSIIDQCNEMLTILGHMKSMNMNMDDSISVACIVNKLPPSWHSFKMSLKHKKEEISIEELATTIQVEEQGRQEATMEKEFHKVLNIEEGESVKAGQNKKRKNSDRDSSKYKGKTQNKKIKGACYHCGKPGHMKRDCRFLKNGKNFQPQRETTNGGGNNENTKRFIGMISEINTLDDENGWWVDSGATRHVCKDKTLFTKLDETNNGEVLYMGNAATALVKGKGTIDLKLTSGNTLSLQDVSFVPEVRRNLISGSMLNKHGFKLVFESNKLVLTKGGTFVGKGYMTQGMFMLNVNKDISAYIVESSTLWHDRLGHLSFQRMKLMSNLDLIPKSNIDISTLCSTCASAKITKRPFPKIEKSYKILELIHSDLCDLHSFSTPDQRKYFCTFIDEFSKFTYVYLLHSKDEVLEKFKIYKAEVENLCNTKIKILRSDNGGEYMFPSFCEEHGIVHETSAAYTPQQNGVAERKNRTLMEMVNSMLKNSGLSKGYWGDALLTACHIQNRVPSKKSSLTPYELWKNRKLNIKYFKVWGCRAIVRLPIARIRKLGGRGIECIFIGYAENTKAYKFKVIEQNDYFGVNSKIESRDAVFFEDKFSNLSSRSIVSSVDRYDGYNDINLYDVCGSHADVDGCNGVNVYGACGSHANVDDFRHSSLYNSYNDSLYDTYDVDTMHNSYTSPIVPLSNDVGGSSMNHVENPDEGPRRSKRARIARAFGPDFVTYLVKGNRNNDCKQIMVTNGIDPDPLTYNEAMRSIDSAFWKEAINEEMDSIQGNNTWIVVDLPPGSKPIGCKWIFKKKMKVDRTIDKFKARLVAKGFTQKDGIDYFDTYAPVARISTIRVLVALASMHNLVIHQMDVKTAFLNGELQEEIYMEQPEGFVLKGHENKVCKLIKSLYGLKQAPKQWHEKFDHVIVQNGFKIHESDKCVYSKFNQKGGIIICLYVDDMLIFGTNLEVVKETKCFLTSKFEMKDLNEAEVILGIRIIRNNNSITLSQSHYIEKVLKKFNCFDNAPVSTPFDPNIRLYKNTGRAVDQIEYARVIGCLMYVMTSTRPDIAFAVGRLSRYTSCPSDLHWHAVKRILKYIKKTLDYGLSYSGYPTVLEGFTDASWITDYEDHTSTSGWIFTLGGGAISWASKKQTLITDSTMASEFVALAACSKEAEWLRHLLLEIPLWPKPMPPVSIHCDSQATLSRAYGQIYNGKSRHIGLRHSYVRQLLTDGIITVDYVKSSQNLADPLTKGLARDLVNKTSIGMGLKLVN